jgi:polyisoprenoid-binding protein YceI
MHRVTIAALLASTLIGAGCARGEEIDVERSTITVHVGKRGLLSMAAHEHWVIAPIAEGVVNTTGPPSVEFKVETAEMRVKPDPAVNDATRAAIQKDMQGVTLQSAKYPEIEFHSTRIEKQGGAVWKVEGMLALHGVTKPVTLTVREDGGAYVGRTAIKQTDFGIQPISVAGGLVKVKNEVQIEFSIVTRP